MAATPLKFSFSSRVILSTAVFIILSGYVKAHQCYWCGPLAEQVHRSRRAPPCDLNTAHLTVCESGYEYCAIVATSPPYTESRYCVKVYQDECYPLFCNSSNTWKMTCPCRGDLCNGLSTEREKEAFSILPRLVAKTHSRIKKRTTALERLVKRGRKIINPNGEEEIGVNTVEDDESQDQPSVTANSGDNDNKEASTETATNEHSDVTAKQEKETQTSAEFTQNVTTTTEIDHFSEIQTSTNMIQLDIISPYPTNADRHGVHKDDIDVQADEPKQETVNVKENDERKNVENTHEETLESTKEPSSEGTSKISSAVPDVSNTSEIGMNHENDDKVEPDVPNTSEIGMNNENDDKIEPSEPTAEAVLHDHSPADKIEPQSTISTTDKTTELTTNTHVPTSTITVPVPTSTITVPVPASTITVPVPTSTIIAPTSIKVTLETKQSPKNKTKNVAVNLSSNVLSIVIQCLILNNLI